MIENTKLTVFLHRSGMRLAPLTSQSFLSESTCSAVCHAGIEAAEDM
jgi:hypothetical protein